ncbi:hypothetical protein CBS101457_003927 [Exobasidium rhododendri]|nr:hypothetical protein CBS101457_003927 [Exobasidium rhododendri]
MAPLSNDELAMLPEEFSAAVESIKSRLPAKLKVPVWGIVCGSGLSGLVDHIEERILINYDEITGFANSTVAGHKSSLAFGYLSSGQKRVPIVAALGRFHLYEGHSAQTCVFPVRIMRCLGAEAVVITNAAGGLHPDWDVGTICAMHDHLSLPTLGSLNPLIGANLPLGPRFPPTSDAYDPLLRFAFFQAAKELQLSHLTTSGTYTYVSGPSYESRAECKFLRQAGADCVGMSTVAEVIAARQAGLRVLAVSLITNKVVVKDYFDAKEAVEKGQDIDDVRRILQDDSKEAASHEEVLEVGKMRAEDIRKLVEHVICNFEL